MVERQIMTKRWAIPWKFDQTILNLLSYKVDIWFFFLNGNRRKN
jgi:hypothetical protein